MADSYASRVEEIFHEALEQPEARRIAFVRARCGGDPRLLAEVEALVAADRQAHRVLDGPAWVERLQPGATTAARLLAGTCIGPYELVRLLGAGGMGTVYEAVQRHPRRTVALKLLRASFASRAALRRFEYEVDLLGRLQHPNIARIYDAGLHADGPVHLPYFAMERIEGAQSLVAFAQQRRLPLRERLALFLKVCDAVQHGHERGVIHRDLKPANVLVDVAGQPKVIDYGVARALDADSRTTTISTTPAEFVGTLQYMAPEQLRGDPALIDTRCDVYALGLLLFELLTERRPHDLAGLSWTTAIRTIEEAPLPDAGRIVAALRGDLSVILTVSTAKDREQRFRTVAELAADIQRYLDDEPISARRPSLIYHARKFAARHRAFVAALAIAGIGLVVGAGLALWKAIEADAARRRAELQSQRAAIVRDVLERILAVSDTSRLGKQAPMRDAIVAAAANLPVTIDQDPLLYGDLQSIIGRAYARMGEESRAIPHLDAAIAARRREPGEPSLLLATALLDRAWLGGPCTVDENIARFRAAAEMYERAPGAKLDHRLAILSYIALIQLEAGRIAEADQQVAEALRLKERTGETADKTYAYALFVRGQVFAARTQYAEAERDLRAALAIKRAANEEHDREVPQMLRELARVLERQNRGAEAQAVRAELEALRTQRSGP